MKLKRNRRNAPTAFYIILAILTCVLAVALVLLSGGRSAPASTGLPAGQESLGESGDFPNNPSGILTSLIDPVPEEATSGAVRSGESTASRETYNPSVSSPRSKVVPGSTGLSFTEEERIALDEMLSGYGANVSVFFQDIGSGASYEYHQDQHYFIASLIKAPYSMYLYQLAEQGKCDLTELITVTEEDKQEGTGTIKDMEDLPKEFTVRELMALAVRQSDNTAMKVLLRKYPASGYRSYAQSIGIEHVEDIQYVTNGQIDAHEAGVYLRAIYQYIETGKYGGELKADMLGTSYVMIQSAYPVARKYGWADGAYHDMAVVYAPQPYLLAICTDRDEGKKEDRAMFGEISVRLETLWSEKYQQTGDFPP